MELLSTFIAYPDQFNEHGVELPEDFFYEMSHRALFKEIREHYHLNPYTSPRLDHLMGILINDNRWQGVPQDYLSRIAGTIALPAHTLERMAHLWRLYRNRHAIDRAVSLVTTLSDGDGEGTEAVWQDLCKAMENPDSGSLLCICSVRDAKDPPLPLFKNGLLPGGFGLVIGRDSIGKGFFIADMILSVSLGRPVGISTIAKINGPPLKVKYLAFEESKEWLRWRFDRISEAAGLNTQAWRDAEAEGHIAITDTAGCAPLFIQQVRDLPVPTDVFHELKCQLLRDKPDLCIIDPLSGAAILSNENDNASVNSVAIQLRRLAAETGTAIILVHHVSKQAQDTNDHQAARGGSALGAAARWVFTMRQDPNDLIYGVVASVAKNSYGRRVDDIRLRRSDCGVLKEVSGAEIAAERNHMAVAIANYLRTHPDENINPEAVKRNNSASAKALIRSLNSKPAEVYKAVEMGLINGVLEKEERKRPGRGETFTVLVAPCAPAEKSDGDDREDDEEEEVLF
jgi:RecA-family ATPase